MCERCRDSGILCGCYGKCYTCGKDVNRGSEGWPCSDCEKWYCDNCRYCNNSCIECNPDNYEDNNTDNEDNNTNNNSDEDSNNSDNNNTNNIVKGG